jgi:nucleotide-binding universal stress UspA family protein
MYSRILVGYQDTEQGRDALELGRVLAQANRAELLIFTAPGEQGEDLGELAQSERADLIVLGPTHRGAVGRVIPGATAGRLLGDAPCAVAVAPAGFGRPADGGLGWRPLGGDPEDAGMRVIGVGYDGSPAARKALDVAAELAIPNGAALRVYAVAAKVSRGALESQAPGVPTRAELLREQLHDAVAELPPEARALPEFRWGFPAAELIAAAGIGVDLMVLGARDGGPVRRALNGSISSAILAEASCPVLITPLHAGAPAALAH